MILYIAEKPQLGKAIADALPGRAEVKDGVIIKGEHRIIWAFGHLLELKDPEEMEETYKRWELDTLPIYFETWESRVKKDKNRQQGQMSSAARVKQITALIRQADLVVNAGDVDEEGQLLVDELIRWAGYSGEVKRLNTADTAKEAMKKALAHMEDNRPHEADGWSAYGRQLGDKIFGYNLTRYYTIKNRETVGKVLPVGRVQTPTLGLVVDRDEQIENHQALVYYELLAALCAGGRHIQAGYVPAEGHPDLVDGRFLQKEPLGKVSAQISGASLEIQIRKETIIEQPPLPFNLTKLNSYCGSRWNYSPAEVMKITQSLRENYKAITYNRSDCQYLSMEHYREAPNVIGAAAENLGLDAGMFDASIQSRCFNDKNITAHFAIIPTNESVPLEKMTEAERRVYTAICEQYLIQFLPPAQKEKTTLSAPLPDGGSLKAVSSLYLYQGYRAFLSGRGEETEQEEGEENRDSGICQMPEGVSQGNVEACRIEEKETRAPARYTPSTLFEDMTRIAKYVKDPEIKGLLLKKDKDKKGENGSIGTSATRAMIIERLIQAGYLSLEKKGRKDILLSTGKGRAFYHMLPDAIKKVDTTAKWWVIQEDIKNGDATPQTLAESVLETIQEILAGGGGTMEGFSEPGIKKEGLSAPCPVCGGKMLPTPFGYGCSHYQEGCRFVIGTVCGKSLTKAQAEKLLSAGVTDEISGFVSKAGKKFSAKLALVDAAGEDGAVEKDSMGRTMKKLAWYHEQKETEISCPECGGHLILGDWNYECGCGYKVSRKIAGRSMKENEVKTLLQKGRTGLLKGFISKTGKKFDACLILQDGGSVNFEFPKKR